MSDSCCFLHCIRLQVKHKYSGLMLDVFREVFNWLPLAYVLKNKVLVLHGGLFSKDGVTLDDLRRVDRYRVSIIQGYSSNVRTSSWT